MALAKHPNFTQAFTNNLLEERQAGGLAPGKGPLSGAQAWTVLTVWDPACLYLPQTSLTCMCVYVTTSWQHCPGEGVKHRSACGQG